MGAAESKNTAEEISSVTNNISNSITVDTSQISEARNEITVNCFVGGSVKVDSKIRNIAKAKQIAKAYTNATVVNDISQSMVQKATSSVGFLGTGYASASNVASSKSTVGNSISAQVQDSAALVSFQTQGFSCGADGYIAGDLEVNFDSENNFVTDQTATSKEIVQLSNSITQSIKQTATATVEGIGGLLLLIIALVIMVFGSVKPPKSSGGSAAVIVGPVLIGTAAGIWGFVARAPPFFSAPILQSPNESSPMGRCRDPLVDVKERTLTLEKAPLRYIFPIVPGDKYKLPSLLELVISKSAGGQFSSNRGYNGKNFDRQGGVQYWAYDDDKFKDYRKKFKEFGRLPNILALYKNGKNNNCQIPDSYIDSTSSSCAPTAFVCGENFKCDGADHDEYKDCNANDYKLNSSEDELDTKLAVPNVDGWREYMLDDDFKKSYARAILCHYLDIALDVYIDNTDIVVFTTSEGAPLVDTGENASSFGSLKVTNFSALNDKNEGLDSSCKITGNFGICSTNLYKFQNSFHVWGLYILVGVMLILAVFIFSKFRRRRK